jgi:hypothetical protein
MSLNSRLIDSALITFTRKPVDRLISKLNDLCLPCVSKLEEAKISPQIKGILRNVMALPIAF